METGMPSDNAVATQEENEITSTDDRADRKDKFLYSKMEEARKEMLRISAEYFQS